MAVAIAEVGAIAERRIAMLIDASVSRLPPFLTSNAGLNSGFMIAHVTAAALASENKSLAHPASVDSLPTSANQEDHVSMATFAARRLQPMIANVAHILGVEWLAAAQGIEFLRPLASSAALEEAHALLRRHCAPMLTDHYLAPDIERASALVREGALSHLPGPAGPARAVDPGLRPGTSLAGDAVHDEAGAAPSPPVCQAPWEVVVENRCRWRRSPTPGSAAPARPIRPPPSSGARPAARACWRW
jgi:hypothetical protein